jgi:hypothetical protein
VDWKGLNVKGTRLTVALDDEPGKMFGVLKVREIGMKIATNDGAPRASPWYLH